MSKIIEKLKGQTKQGMNKTSTENVLEIVGLIKTFKTGSETLTILKGCNMNLKKGEIVALVGPSGCGKSTLLQCAGLLETPSRGIISVLGQTTTKMNEATRTALRRDAIGFVYQKHHLLEDFTAIENVMFPMMTRGLDKDEAKSRAEYLLNLVSMSHRATHRPMELSGGEQQRVAIARALANNPAILLADEPTGNLDPEHAEKVFNLILSLVKKTNLAMLMVTHDLNLAKRADRVLYIENGLITQ